MSNFEKQKKLLKLLKEFSENKSRVYQDDFANFVGQRGLDEYNKNKKDKDIHLNLEELNRCIDDGFIKKTKSNELSLTSKGDDIIDSSYRLKKVFNHWIIKLIVGGIITGIIGYLLGRLGC